MEHVGRYFCNYTYFKMRSVLKGRPSIIWSIYNVLKKDTHRKLPRASYVPLPKHWLTRGATRRQRHRKSLLSRTLFLTRQTENVPDHFSGCQIPCRKQSRLRDKIGWAVLDKVVRAREANCEDLGKHQVCWGEKAQPAPLHLYIFHMYKWKQ